MQTYVATFGYLRRIQLRWDHSKLQRESNVSRELKDLLLSSRAMLCELEIAVNKTQPHWRRSDTQSAIPHISRQQMDKRLKLRTKQQVEQRPGDVLGADSIDLKFVKFYYYEYLKHMWKILRDFLKNKDKFRLEQELIFNEIEKYPLNARRKQKNRKRTYNKQQQNTMLSNGNHKRLPHINNDYYPHHHHHPSNTQQSKHPPPKHSLHSGRPLTNLHYMYAERLQQRQVLHERIFKNLQDR